MGRRAIDLTGQKFARLTAIERRGKSNNGYVWLCECECGGRCLACSSHLKRGSTKSCGCLPKGYKYEV